MKKINIYMDMDGTIANLYSYKNWLKYLTLESIAPYEFCKPMVNMSELIELLKSPVVNKVYIVSWLSKNGSQNYNRKVRYSKLRWLINNGLDSSIIYKYIIVPYGTNKAESIGKQLNKNDLLLDDEENNRIIWNEAGGTALDEKNLIEKMKKYIDTYAEMC